MSGWGGRGPRARAASTSSAKAAARSGGTARSHSAVICLARTFAASRCSRSYLDLFVIWSSYGIPGISADLGNYLALFADACPAASARPRQSHRPATVSDGYGYGPDVPYGVVDRISGTWSPSVSVQANIV